jgi:hypothetical protein
MTLSFIHTYDTRTYYGYISLIFSDALTTSMYSTSDSHKATIIFFILLSLLLIIATIKIKHKLLIISSYLFLSLILLGSNSILNIYDPIFTYFPLMRSIRSLHRFSFFQMMIIFSLLYQGLLSLSISKEKFKNYFFYIFAFLFITISFFLTYKSRFYFTQVKIPSDYFQVNAYFAENTDRKIYFPAYFPVFQGIAQNYTWFKFKAINESVYTNPFTTLFSLQNLVHLEGYPLDPHRSEIRSLIDYETKNTDEIIQALEYEDIHYLIIDKNYLWSKNFPNINLEALTKSLKLQKKFGNIYIYELEKKNCLPSNGDYKLGYCTSSNPKYLINESIEEYALDSLLSQSTKYKVGLNKQKKIYPAIVSYEPQHYINTHNIHIPSVLYEIQGGQKDLFIIKPEKNTYILFIPILKSDKKSFLFENSSLLIYKNSRLINRISPYGEKIGINWEKVQFNIKKGDKITVNTQGKDIILGHPLLFTEKEYISIIKNNMNKHYFLIE